MNEIRCKKCGRVLFLCSKKDSDLVDSTKDNKQIETSIEIEIKCRNKTSDNKSCKQVNRIII